MKAAVLGHFGGEKTHLNGQTIKAKNLCDGLKEYTALDVEKINSYGWNRHPLRLLMQIRRGFRSCESVIMLPAHKGLRVFAPILALFRKIYRKKIFYDVIGGWLPDMTAEKKRLAKTLKRFDGIWVETSTMADRLKKQGFENVQVVPNFKALTIGSREALDDNLHRPLRLCIFSRVMREKGIETAVQMIRKINENVEKPLYQLDIYGPVQPEFREDFEKLRASFPPEITYRGEAAPEKSPEVLRDYFALLFPTQFYTEGIPGTIIDAYAAGVPVICAKWESFSDVVDQGMTGLGYRFDDLADMERVLLEVAKEPERILAMKEKCLERAVDFSPAVLQKIVRAVGAEPVA